MNKPEHFEILEDRAVYRPTGEMSLQQAVQLVTTGIAFSREHQIRKLLLDITCLTGFEPPNLATKYFLFRDWARIAEGRVCVAFVSRPEMIDREKMGIMVGKNAGFHSDAFTSEEEATAWLQSIR